MAFSRFRFPLVALAILALLAALWAGWIRLGWQWPVLEPALIGSHGPLMVSGFLGTLIAVERAVALRKFWAYLGPLASAAGAVLLIAGLRGPVGPLLMTLASLGLVGVFAVIIRRQPAYYTVSMGAGALAWLVGNLFWLFGWPIFHIVLWWGGFLILTIAGERLELGRITRLHRRTELALLGAGFLYVTGLVVMLHWQDIGTRIVGVGLLALSVWLLSNDISRRTVRKPGLPRYAAICLLSGYVWLGIAGLLALINGAVVAGFPYNALLHSIFLGFVISMIFGHAPIIFPAILGLPVTFYPFFYLQLALLHASLLLRVGGDIFQSVPARLWGGLFNGIALLIFLASTAYMIQQASRSAQRQSTLA